MCICFSTRIRRQSRSKFANIPGVTSLPEPRRADGGDAAVLGLPMNQAADRLDGPTGTRLVGLESRVSVAEKSTRALLVEVVRLQTSLSSAMRSLDDERAARRDADNRMRTASDAVNEVAARLEREEQRRRTDDDATKTLIATAQNAEATALAARQEAFKRVDEHSNRYQFFVNTTRILLLDKNIILD